MSTIETQIEHAERRWHEVSRQRGEVQHELGKLEHGGTPDWLKFEERHRLRRRLTRMGEYEAAERLVNGEDAAANVLERIIGRSQLFGIEFFERGLIAARAVARVEIRGRGQTLQGYGSGVLVSSRLFLTNNHVVPDLDTAAGSLAQFEYLTSATGAAREPLLFRMRPDEFFITDEQLDITLVALEATNEAGQSLTFRGWCPLIPGSGKVIKGEGVNIIQHPSGERMQVTVRENTVIALEGDFIQYETDTQPGSSGSPVFNDRWEMAALHHAGVPKRDAQKRILLRDGSLWTGRREDEDEIDWVANEGVRISSLIEFVNREYSAKKRLTAEQRALWEACFSPPRPLELWDLFSIQQRNGGDEWSTAAVSRPGPSGPLVQTVDDECHMSWMFRLSFGPVTGPGTSGNSRGRSSTNAPARLPAAPLVAPRQRVVPAALDRSTSGTDMRSAAERFIERFRHRGPYYDDADDAEAAESYWDKFNWNAQPRTLFSQLSRRLESTHTKRHSYAEARHKFLYPAVDLHEDGKLRNIYSGTALDPAEAIMSELARVLPRAEAQGFEMSGTGLERLLASDEAFDVADEAGEPFNCEHVVPQSWFDKKEPMRSDLHHLFVCEPDCNSFRGNTPYWQFPVDEEVVRERCGRRENDKFEPEHGKGPIARATMYFLVRYPGAIGDANRELSSQRLGVLLDWHQNDPISTYERHRNWLIHKAQGNRNPFIDQPSAAEKALLRLGFSRGR